MINTPHEFLFALALALIAGPAAGYQLRRLAQPTRRQLERADSTDLAGELYDRGWELYRPTDDDDGPGGGMPAPDELDDGRPYPGFNALLLPGSEPGEPYNPPALLEPGPEEWQPDGRLTGGRWNSPDRMTSRFDIIAWRHIDLYDRNVAAMQRAGLAAAA